ncbi:MAG: hypothetical protein A2Y73_04935 [Chloroflexi bacterium RBG_13_56_8]|nr:MAG: hypothetical protein A2Y73_04935 [Chloroflexi bacterium RBG_13_56_8]
MFAVPRTLVVGYGNISRRDDGVGHYVAERIQDQGVESIHTMVLQQLGPELAETISDYDLVVFVDVYLDKNAEGLQVISVESLYRPSAITHSLSPSSLLALTQALYHRQPRAIIVAIPGYDFDFGMELSEGTERWAGVAVERILKIHDETEEKPGGAKN